MSFCGPCGHHYHCHEHYNKGCCTVAGCRCPGYVGADYRKPAFQGATFDQERDGERLSRQMQKVREAMLSGQEWTLAALSAETGEPEASISARLRDLRKPQFGSHNLQRRNVGGGTWVYWLVLGEAA